MAKVICLMGESGSGKTTSLRNLPPEESLIIDCDGKGLSWKGWKSQYNTENKNYIKTDEAEKVLNIMMRINGVDLFTGEVVENPLPDVRYLIIDTLNGIMVADEMKRLKEKGYDKWQDLAMSVYNIVKYANKLRDDLTVIFTAHTETVNEDNGYTFTRIKTSGRKLTKINLESMLTTVLYAKCVDGRYLFETQSNNSTAKSPLGAFEDFEIENDIVKVIKALEEF